MTCAHCDQPIPAARLAALPRTRTCRDCSTEQPIRGALLVDRDGDVETVILRDPAEARRLDLYRRAEREIVL